MSNNSRSSAHWVNITQSLIFLLFNIQHSQYYYYDNDYYLPSNRKYSVFTIKWKILCIYFWIVHFACWWWLFIHSFIFYTYRLSLRITTIWLICLHHERLTHQRLCESFPPLLYFFSSSPVHGSNFIVSAGIWHLFPPHVRFSLSLIKIN